MKVPYITTKTHNSVKPFNALMILSPCPPTDTHSRVILKSQDEDDFLSTYINANYLKVRENVCFTRQLQYVVVKRLFYFLLITAPSCHVSLCLCRVMGMRNKLTLPRRALLWTQWETSGGWCGRREARLLWWSPIWRRRTRWRQE